MDVLATDIPDVKLIVPRRFGDARGQFAETYRSDRLAAAGIDVDFVQDNQSVSVPAGTVRGLHFQTPPHAQAKLVRVVRGRILDVAVDLRVGSPTFGRSVVAELTAENWHQLYVPVGFAHGFCTLEANCAVVYKVSGYYAPEHDTGIFWNDPDLGIDWPVAEDAAVVSDKDRRLPRLRDIVSPFRY